MLDYLCDGDVLFVSTIDRLGRDAIDVQKTISHLLLKGVKVNAVA
jgi:putative DNA-invertase from lambdoid prophage Rac